MFGIWLFRHVFGLGLMGVALYTILWRVYIPHGSVSVRDVHAEVLSVMLVFILVSAVCYIQESREVARVLLAYRLRMMCAYIINMDFDECEELFETNPSKKVSLPGLPN